MPPYGKLNFVGYEHNNTYSWTTRWNSELKIIEVRVYLDTAMLQEALANNEVRENFVSSKTM